MTPHRIDRSAAVLASPEQTLQWQPGEWADLVAQARQAGLLARIALLMRSTFEVEHWPTGVSGHFDSALRLCRAQQLEIHRETGYIRKALGELQAPVVLLKGAAYVMADLPPAAGRVFGDVDILVPKASLARAESQLVMHGWITTHESAYDQRYYRKWMHELPPMQHVHRRTMLDVHHAIVPDTARLRPDSRKLFERAVPLPGRGNLHVLSPEDMVLHSMTHLFTNDDMSYALRDLSDMDLLLRHFGERGDFWGVLLRRAIELDLARPLYYGLLHAQRLLSTPIPLACMQEASHAAPGVLTGRVMAAIWSRALRSPHPGAAARLGGAALFALYLRGHWLRMPPMMLARHLCMKASMRWQEVAAQRADKPTA